MNPIRTIAILRGVAPAEAVALARRSWDAGIDLVEVPVQDDEAWPSLEAVLQAADGRPVGAGTVTTADRAVRAVELGVAVCICPGLHPAVIEVARSTGVPVLPGVLTPSEVQSAIDLGVAACKMFPAGTVGPGHLQALRPVFPGLAFVPTGGVGTGNARTFVDAGASALAFGGSLEQVLADATAVRHAAQIEKPWIPTPLPTV